MVTLWTKINSRMACPRLMWSLMLILFLVSAYYLSTKILYKDTSEVRHGVHAKYNKFKRIQNVGPHPNKKAYRSAYDNRPGRPANRQRPFGAGESNVGNKKSPSGFRISQLKQQMTTTKKPTGRIAPFGHIPKGRVENSTKMSFSNRQGLNRSLAQKQLNKIGVYGKNTIDKINRNGENSNEKNRTPLTRDHKPFDTPDNRKQETPDNKKHETLDRKQETSDNKKHEISDRKQETSDNKKHETSDRKQETSDNKKQETSDNKKHETSDNKKHETSDNRKPDNNQPPVRGDPNVRGLNSNPTTTKRPNSLSGGKRGGLGHMEKDNSTKQKRITSQNQTQRRMNTGKHTQTPQRVVTVYGSIMKPTRLNTTNMPKWVHLDLKGAPPKMEYLQTIIPIWKSWGVTGVLIEYEDTFPYTERLEVLHSKKGYSSSQIADLLTVLEKNNMEPIPLVQSIGHLEFVLKHPSFEKFREDPKYPAFLNPGMKDSVNLITDMIDQVMRAHKRARFLHIGADEVAILGTSKESISAISNQNLKGSRELFMRHIKSIAQYVKNKYPDVKVLMWDDMLRNIPLEVIEKSKLASYVEPVVWNYLPNITEKLGVDMWQKYSMVFDRVWVGSAFKGASGSNQHLPDLTVHVNNQLSWLNVIKWLRQKHPHLKIGGFVLTGWSRYDHFSALCDLLPASMPSLALCLQIINNGAIKYTLSKASSRLHCPAASGSNSIFQKSPNLAEFSYRDIPADWRPDTSDMCNFPGHDIFYIMLRYHKLLKQFELSFDPITGKTRGHCNRFSIGHMFIDPYRVDNYCSKFAKQLLDSFVNFENLVHTSFRRVYDSDVITEWLEENLINFEMWLKQYDDKVKAAAGRSRVWGQRPDKHIDKLKERVSGVAGVV